MTTPKTAKPLPGTNGAAPAKQSLDIDLNDLTIDETIEFERISGIALDQFGEEGAPKAPAIKALAYLAMRRDNPDITLDDIGAMRLSEFDLSVGESGPNPPDADA